MSTENLYLADSKQFANAKWSNLYIWKHDSLRFNSNKKTVAELRFKASIKKKYIDILLSNQPK
jgi:hypothetical protein